MKIRTIHYIPKFLKQWSALSRENQIRATKTMRQLQEDPFHPSLRLHRLHGNFRHYWSISVDKKIRIILQIKKDTALFYSIGSHAIYEKR